MEHNAVYRLEALFLARAITGSAAKGTRKKSVLHLAVQRPPQTISNPYYKKSLKSMRIR
jgi:hypothetical protein